MAPDALTAAEGAFNAAPSLVTLGVWHDAAIAAYNAQEITIEELENIGQAIRAWIRVNT